MDEAIVKRQERTEILSKRKSKPSNRFSPDLFKKPNDQSKSLSLEKDCKQTKPTFCESCFVSFKKAALLSKKEYRRRFFDPVTNKILILCNACGVRMARAVSGRPKKQVVKETPSDNDKNEYKVEMTRFTEIIISTLDDFNATRLACPSTTPKLCRCIQNYITAKSPNCIQTLLTDSSGSTGWKTRALELLHLYKEARRLRDQKSVRRGSKGISLNTKRRSKEYEQYVFSTRERLKKELMICEHGAQKLLIYSNNFLHKQLKSSPDKGPRIPRKSNLPSLDSVQDLVSIKCCKNRCTKLAITHSKLLQNWRAQAKLSQKDARHVLAEMLTPSAGKSTNCHLFIRLVTGCSIGLLCKVSRNLRSSQGEREPIEHGLRKYWHQRKVHTAVKKDLKSCKKSPPLQPVTTSIKSLKNQINENTSFILSMAENNRHPSLREGKHIRSLHMTDCPNIQGEISDKQETLGSSVCQNTKSVDSENSETISQCTNIVSNSSNCIQYIPVSVIQSNSTKNHSNLIPESSDLSYQTVEHCISEPLRVPSSSLRTEITEIPLVDSAALQSVSIEGLNVNPGESIIMPVILQGAGNHLSAAIEPLHLQPTLIWTTSGLFILSATGTNAPSE